MGELGIDISGQRSKNVDEFAGQSFDYVLTVCDNAKESCPIFPGNAVTIHRSFEDPAALEADEEQRLALFRRVRDEMSDYLLGFPPSLLS
jgi:arsenate reductase